MGLNKKTFALMSGLFFLLVNGCFGSATVAMNNLFNLDRFFRVDVDVDTLIHYKTPLSLIAQLHDPLVVTNDVNAFDEFIVIGNLPNGTMFYVIITLPISTRKNCQSLSVNSRLRVDTGNID